MQKGFITQENSGLENKIDSLIINNEFKHTIATQFINTKNSNFVKLLDWEEMQEGSQSTDICNKIRETSIKTIKKNTYGSTELIEHLKNQGIKQTLIVGVDTDACVLKIALDIFDADIEPYVLTEYCGSSGGLAYHDLAIKLLRRLIGDRNVVTNSYEFIKELKIKNR